MPGALPVLPSEVQKYLAPLPELCEREHFQLASIALFGSSVKAGFYVGQSDVDLIDLLGDPVTRGDRIRLQDALSRLEDVYGLRTISVRDKTWLERFAERPATAFRASSAPATTSCQATPPGFSI